MMSHSFSSGSLKGLISSEHSDTKMMLFSSMNIFKHNIVFRHVIDYDNIQSGVIFS